MDNFLSSIEKDFYLLENQRNAILKELKRAEDEITFVVDKVNIISKSLKIINETTKQTQDFVCEKINNLCSLALQSVFTDKDYEFKLLFDDSRRNQTECVPVVLEHKLGGVIDEWYPKDDDLGFSVLNTLSIALRFVLYWLDTPRSINTFILDEPFLSVGRKEELIRIGNMIKKLSMDNNIQLIIFTHEDRIREISDRCWEITNEDGKATANLIEF